VWWRTSEQCGGRGRVAGRARAHFGEEGQDMISNREALMHLSREVERVAVLRERIFATYDWSDEARANSYAMSAALEGAHLAFAFDDDAGIAKATLRLQEFKAQ
jgi:hypothetical protein